MKHRLLSAAFLPSCALVLGGETPNAPGITWRSYDLAAVAPLLPEDSSTTQLLPALAAPWQLENSSSGERRRAAEFLAEVSVLPITAEFEREGRAWTMNDTALQVCASAEAHKLLEREFAFFATAFRADTLVRIDIVDGEFGTPGLPARIPVATADELLARAQGQSRVRTVQLRIAPGDEVRLDQTRSLRMVADYDVEIAQQSIAYQPLVRSFRVGTELVARAAAVSDGVQLALVVRQVDEVAPPRERTLEFSNHIGSDQAWTDVIYDLTFQTPRVVQHAEALNTFLPKGEAVLVRSSFANLETNSRCTFVLRAVGDAPPPAPGLDLFENGYRIDVVDLSRFAPPRVTLAGNFGERGSGARLLDGFFGESTWEGDSPLSAHLGLYEEDLEAIEERLFPFREDVARQRFGPWLVLQPTSVDSEAAHPRNFDPATAVQIAKSKSVELEVVLRRGDAVAARWSALVVDGRRSAFTIGSESVGLDSASIEVAQSASVFDPQTRVFFDGLTVIVEPRRLADGRVDVGVTARAMLLDVEPTWSAGMTGATAPIDRATWSTLVSDEHVLVQPSGEPKSAVLGIAGKGGLSLEIVVH